MKHISKRVSSVQSAGHTTHKTKSAIQHLFSSINCLLLASVLIICSSCCRSAASGCGTWPMAKQSKMHNGMPKGYTKQYAYRR